MKASSVMDDPISRRALCVLLAVWLMRRVSALRKRRSSRRPIPGKLGKKQRKKSGQALVSGEAFAQFIKRCSAIAQAQRRRPRDLMLNGPDSIQKAVPWTATNIERVSDVSCIRFSSDGDGLQDEMPEGEGVRVAFVEGTLCMRRTSDGLTEVSRLAPPADVAGVTADPHARRKRRLEGGQ